MHSSVARVKAIGGYFEQTQGAFEKKFQISPHQSDCNLCVRLFFLSDLSDKSDRRSLFVYSLRTVLRRVRMVGVWRSVPAAAAVSTVRCA